MWKELLDVFGKNTLSSVEFFLWTISLGEEMRKKH